MADGIDSDSDTYRSKRFTCMADGIAPGSGIQTATHTGVKGMMQILNLGYLLFTLRWSNDCPGAVSISVERGEIQGGINTGVEIQYRRV
jgi:hypothetical protein